MVTRSKVISAMKFYASKLMTHRLSDSLTVFVRFKTDIPYAGLCTWLDEPRRPKEFAITINPDMADDPIEQTLAHEMVHVKQYAKGELKDLLSYPDLVVWQGSRRHCDNDGADYMSLPWEIEAFDKERTLYLEYMSNNGRKF